MNCEQALSTVELILAGDDVTTEERSDMNAHIETCESCRSIARERIIDATKEDVLRSI